MFQDYFWHDSVSRFTIIVTIRVITTCQRKIIYMWRYADIWSKLKGASYIRHEKALI